MLDVGDIQVAVFNIYLSCTGSVTKASNDADIELCYHFIYYALLLVNLDNGGYTICDDFNCNSVGMA